MSSWWPIRGDTATARRRWAAPWPTVLECQCPGADGEEAVGRKAKNLTASAEDRYPHTIKGEIPVVAVTGTNGKTTTSRMIAHISPDRRQGWWASQNTDGIYLDGELVEAGDYSGPSGAGTVLGLPGVEFAVTDRDRARGGILLKEIDCTPPSFERIGGSQCHADHLGLQGIDTLDQLAEVARPSFRGSRGAAGGPC